MGLFDELERTDTRPKRERESDFEYLNSSARIPIGEARQVLDSWFEAYPYSGKVDLLARFRSPIDAQHQSAFWELYIHELFSRLGFILEAHPDIENSANHPDFLVKEGENLKFYLEATVAGLPSVKNAGAEARLAEVFDLVNKLQASEWFLHVAYRGMPNTPPPVKELRSQLEKWLGMQDQADIEAALLAKEWSSLPQFEWSHDGLTLTFTPSPRSQKSKGNPDVRPIGITMGEAHMLETDEDIRRAVESKAKKYGTLPLPLVVAVNVLSEHCDAIDINNALLGSETVILTTKADGSHGAAPGQRLPNGVWFGKKGARNQTASAVLIGSKIDVYSCGSKTPLLVHHPYPTHRLILPSYPMPESVPDEETHTMKRKDGKNAGEFLRLPNPWPPVHD